MDDSKRLTKFANNKTCCVDFMKTECRMKQGNCCKCSTNEKVWDKLRYFEELQEQNKLIITDIPVDKIWR